VRCIECVTEPITPGHFCECCGRKLSLDERKGLNTAAAIPAASSEPVVAEPVVLASAPVRAASPTAAASSASCESCGGPSDDGGLCALCQSAFQALLEDALPKTETGASDDQPTTDAATLAVEPSPATGTAQFGYLSDTSSLFTVADVVTPGAPPLPIVNAAPIFDDDAMKATEEEAARVEAAEAARIEADREAARVEAARLEAEKETARAEAARVEAAKKEQEEREREEAVREAVRAQAARNKAAENSQRAAPKAATLPLPGKHSGAPGRSGRTGSIVGMAAAVAIVASIGLGVGAAWYKMQGLPQPGQSAPAAAAPKAPLTENASKAPDPIAIAEAAIKASEAAAAASERAAAQALASAALKLKASAPGAAAARVPPKTVHQPIIPTGQVATAAAPAVIEPVRELVAPPPPPPPVVVTPAASIVSNDPVRPFFEPKDVNEQPVVANRVEPLLSDDLKARDISEVLVVRLLVSQTGHPSSISLLRRSKTGPSVDDAVVAAVKQWTFAPAKKKGETVSCWLNIGVPVGRTN
jgi:TonB family protein